MSDLTAEQKIDRAHFYIMSKPEWVGYSGVIMVGTVEISNDVATACTDGFNVAYGRAFIDSLTEQEIRFVVLHENLHKMFRHLVIWRALFMQDQGRANRAADYVINLIIQEAGDPGVEPPKGITLLNPKFAGMDTGEVFKQLPPSPPCPFCQAGADHPNGSGKPGQGTCPNEGGFDVHDWKGAGAVSKEEEADRAAQIDSAIRQGAVLAGNLAGKMPRGFDELMEIPIDWREVLRQFISSMCKGGDYATFRRPSRRWLQYDMYMPSTITETLDNVLICGDTSGSIQGVTMTQFVSCVVGILQQVNPARTDLLWWDSAVAGHEVYFQGEVEKMKTSTSPVGGGGTSPSCITEYLKEHKMTPTCAIVLTDGYVGSDWGGDWPCPVLWVIKDNKAARPTVGTAVHF